MHDKRDASRLGLPSGIRACLFDLDGVLTQTARVHAAAWEAMFDAFLRDVLEAAGIGDLFEVRIDGLVAEQEHLQGKPAPDTFLAAARKLDVEPAEAAVFEDALAGVAAGRAGNFGFVVGVDRAGQAEALREHGADVVVDDLAELLA
jgi:beta-phosphoglucomutase-like phosphatase (HAD superfamily)